jgi:hypothetical protein
MKPHCVARAWLPLSLALCAVAHAAPGDQAGVFVDGSIHSLFRICSTCPTPSEVDDQRTAGGFGSNGPAIASGFDTRGTANASYDGRALIVGGSLLPELHAAASAVPGIGSHVGFSAPGAYLLSSSASTRAVQYFSYRGAVPETYRISYVIRGGAFGASADDEPLVTVSGGLALFDDGDKLGGELPLGHTVDRSQKTFTGAAHDFVDGGTVSITVAPGQSFYLSAFLSAGVAQVDGVADASHSFTSRFTAGDPSLLTAALAASPVDEAPAAALLALGLAGLGAVRWRRR